MRLWHKDMLGVLPRQQLVAQLRECVLIAKNIKELGKPNHILVNKIMDYDWEEYVSYIQLVLYEFKQRGYNVRKQTLEKLEAYTGYPFPQWYDMDIRLTSVPSDLFKGWHDSEYFKICFYNLLEKSRCGGVPSDDFKRFYDYCESYLSNYRWR